jgi:hypothetical protein
MSVFVHYTYGSTEVGRLEFLFRKYWNGPGLPLYWNKKRRMQLVKCLLINSTLYNIGLRPSLDKPHNEG